MANRWFLISLWVMMLALCADVAKAQTGGARVVTTCGAASYSAGQIFPPTMDITGNLCGGGTAYPEAPILLNGGTCASACASTAIVPSTATQGLQSVQLQVISAGVGVTAVLEGSDDPDCSTASNWSASGINMASALGNPTASSVNVSSLNFVGVITSPITTNCIRVFITAYSSGTYTIQGYMSPAKSNVESILGPVSLYATPGNATQVGQGATGTTGAIAPALAATANVSNYVCHIDVSSAGTATPAAFSVTVTGLADGTLTIVYWALTTGQDRYQQDFSPCLKASGTNTAITLNVPALGTGTSVVAANITGFQY